MKRIAFIATFLMLCTSTLLSQTTDKGFWDEVELQVNFDLRDAHFFNFDVNEAEKYLTTGTDEAGLLNDSYSSESPIGIEGNSNDYGSGWSPNSQSGKRSNYVITLQAYKPISVPYIHNFLYVGTYVSYLKNAGLLNQSYEGYSYDGYQNQFNQFPYSTISFYQEQNIMDTVVFSDYRSTDTAIVPRTKLVYFQNPKTRLAVGLSLKPVIFRSKSDRVRLLGLIRAGVSRSKNEVKVYSTYMNYENLANMENVHGDSLASDYSGYELYDVQLLNPEGVSDQNFSYQAPAIYSTTISAGLELDFKFKKWPIRLGLSSNIGSEKFKREGEKIADSNFWSIGLNISYIL
jgi:hypothetical protein